MIRRLAAFGVRRKGLSDSATLLPVSGQFGLASVQIDPFQVYDSRQLRMQAVGKNTCRY
jgi:hypothetical protein